MRDTRVSLSCTEQYVAEWQMSDTHRGSCSANLTHLSAADYFIHYYFKPVFFYQSYLWLLACLFTVACLLASGWATEWWPPSPAPHFIPAPRPAATGRPIAGSAPRHCEALTASLCLLPPSAATPPPAPPRWTRTPPSARVESATQTWLNWPNM